jgi:hypothetical protein
LSSKHAVSMSVDHLDKRREFLRRAVECGWVPLRRRSDGREVAPMILTDSQ